MQPWPGNKVNTFWIHYPADGTTRIFSFQGRNETGGPQDITLSPAFDDENMGMKRLEMGAVLTESLKLAGFITPPVTTIGSKHHQTSDFNLPIYAITSLETQAAVPGSFDLEKSLLTDNKHMGITVAFIERDDICFKSQFL
jgi:hypothetical protein